MSRLTDAAAAVLSTAPAEGMSLARPGGGEYPLRSVAGVLSDDYAATGNMLGPQREERIREGRRDDYRDLSDSVVAYKGLPVTAVFMAAVEGYFMEQARLMRPREGASVRDLRRERSRAPLPEAGNEASRRLVEQVISRCMSSDKRRPLRSRRLVEGFFREYLGKQPYQDLDVVVCDNRIREVRSEADRAALAVAFAEYVKRATKAPEGVVVDASSFSREELAALPRALFEVLRYRLVENVVSERMREAALDFLEQEGRMNDRRIAAFAPFGAEAVMSWVKESGAQERGVRDGSVLAAVIPAAYFAASLEEAFVFSDIILDAFRPQYDLQPKMKGYDAVEEQGRAARCLVEAIWKGLHECQDLDFAERVSVIQGVMERYGIPAIDDEALRKGAVLADGSAESAPSRSVAAAMAAALHDGNRSVVDVICRCAYYGGDVMATGQLAAAVSEAVYGRHGEEMRLLRDLEESQVAAFTERLSGGFDDEYVMRQVDDVRKDVEVAPSEAIGYSSDAEKEQRKVVPFPEDVQAVKAVCFEGSVSAGGRHKPVFFVEDPEAWDSMLLKATLEDTYGSPVTMLPLEQYDDVFARLVEECRAGKDGTYVEAAHPYKDTLYLHDGCAEDFWSSTHPSLVRYRKEAGLDFWKDVFLSPVGYKMKGRRRESFLQIYQRMYSEFCSRVGVDAEALGGRLVTATSLRPVLEHRRDGVLFFGLKAGDEYRGGYTLRPEGRIQKDYNVERYLGDTDYLRSDRCVKDWFYGLGALDPRIGEAMAAAVLDEGFGVDVRDGMARSHGNRYDDIADYVRGKGHDASFWDGLAKMEDQGPDFDPLEDRFTEPDGASVTEEEEPNLAVAQRDIAGSSDEALFVSRNNKGIHI